jgi:hypothetical protein
MKALHKIVVFLTIVTCCAASNSCFTIRYSASGVQIPTGIKSVSVQYFENVAPTVEAGLSQQFTEGLKDYIQSNTRLILVNGTGDVDFEGTISGYDVKPTSIVSGDQAAKDRFTITVKVKFICDTDPDLSYDASFSRYEDFDANKNFEQVKSDLTDDIVKLLIEDIFNKAFVNW